MRVVWNVRVTCTMSIAPPSLSIPTGQWSRFDKMKWTSGRAILRHTSSFFTYIRRIRGRENQLEISGFGRIVPLFVLDSDENMRNLSNEEMHQSSTTTAPLVSMPLRRIGDSSWW